ncbi:MAG: bacteriohemerythrin [Treponema sp.]|nr:bacteriohemerythrin [Treponema sp.]MCL2251544.1 bacteriohemerythrin [Treponema sp.]
MTNLEPNESLEIVVWEDKYATGISLIDSQHHKLVKLTNQLYLACRKDSDALNTAFKDAMSQMVQYVRFHFNVESKLLEVIGYPEYKSHKKMHDDLIKKILDAVKDFNDGKKFVANQFVRTLKDWVFSHIAVYDKQYSFYILDLLKRGLITEAEIKRFEKSAADSVALNENN